MGRRPQCLLGFLFLLCVGSLPGPPLRIVQGWLGPACSPSPFLKMMPTLPALPASSLLYMIHSGFILESMKVHCSTLPAREWGPQVLLRRPGGWEEPW